MQIIADEQVQYDQKVDEEVQQWRKKKDEKEMKVLQVVQQCSDLYDFELIEQQLSQNNWNVNKVVNNYQETKKLEDKVELVLINCSNNQNKYVLTLKKHETGMDIIQHLIAVRPLSSLAGQGGDAYNIYRDAEKKSCINYVLLSSSLKDLEIDK